MTIPPEVPSASSSSSSNPISYGKHYHPALDGRSDVRSDVCSSISSSDYYKCNNGQATGAQASPLPPSDDGSENPTPSDYVVKFCSDSDDFRDHDHPFVEGSHRKSEDSHSVSDSYSMGDDGSSESSRFSNKVASEEKDALLAGSSKSKDKKKSKKENNDNNDQTGTDDDMIYDPRDGLRFRIFAGTAAVIAIFLVLEAMLDLEKLLPFGESTKTSNKD